MWKRRLADYLQTHSDEDIIRTLTADNLVSACELPLDLIIGCSYETRLALFHYWSTIHDKNNLSKYNTYILQDSLNTARDFKNDKWRTLSIEFDELSEEDICSVLDSIEDPLFFDKRLRR